MRYEICDDKEGEWVLGLQNASFRLCRAISIYDLVIKMKSAVYRRLEELSETPIRKGPEVFHDLSSNCSLNTQVSFKKAMKKWNFLGLLHILLRRAHTQKKFT